MDQTATLIAAVGALWAALQLLGGGVIRYLVVQRAADADKCEKRIKALEDKLNESSDLIRRQAQTMPLPTGGQSAWQWIAVVAVTALWLFTAAAR